MWFRVFYFLLWTLLLPLACLRLLWRGRGEAGYLRHWNERFGGGAPLPAGRWYLVHAVSVGETRAAAPLVRAILAAHGQNRVLLTGTTPAGRETAAQLFGAEARVTYRWLPWDHPALVRRWLARVRPQAALVMETEWWPGLFAACAAQQVPLALVNVRLSARSARGYARRVRALARQMLTVPCAVLAQGRADARRLRFLGARQVTVCGNLKFDVPQDAAQQVLGEQFRAAFGARPVLLLASSRDGEEADFLAALAQAALPPETLVAIVPRHPQRFDEVARLLERAALPYARRSRNEAVTQTTRVWLGDSLGELAACYGAADVALIGGSWRPFGGQNLIEACAAGVPVLLGPHTWNFRDAAHAAVSAQAALQVADFAAALQEAAALLTEDERRTYMGEQARRFARTHQGACARTLAALRQAGLDFAA